MVFECNSAFQGGALAAELCSIYLTNATFNANSATGDAVGPVRTRLAGIGQEGLFSPSSVRLGLDVGAKKVHHDSAP